MLHLSKLSQFYNVGIIHLLAIMSYVIKKCLILFIFSLKKQ